MKKLWEKIESPNLLPHIKDNDYCIYAREYISGKSYDYCETNNLILNFKKPPSKKKNPNEWRHRNKAIRRFKNEIKQLKQLFIKPKLRIITAIPSSKKKR